MSKKIWHLKYVAGNPKIFKKVTSASCNPMMRSEALDTAKDLPDGWRVWVEREGSGERIYESDTETQYSKA